MDYIQRYLAEYGCGPLIREIQLGCHIVSYKSTIDRLIALERKRLIERIPNKHRGIRLAESRPSTVVSGDIPSLEGAA